MIHYREEDSRCLGLTAQTTYLTSYLTSSRPVSDLVSKNKVGWEPEENTKLSLWRLHVFANTSTCTHTQTHKTVTGRQAEKKRKRK